MVDVGYFINGRHGVIRNVSLTANPYSDHRVFTSVDCKEQYCMKVDDIEYIIPSDIECVSGKNLLPPKPMTFAEKFKEVFGYEPNKDIYMCDVINCSLRIKGCQGCPYKSNDWDDPYVKAEVD